MFDLLLTAALAGSAVWVRSLRRRVKALEGAGKLPPAGDLVPRPGDAAPG